MQPLRIYSTDLSFYDGYMEKLVEEARAGFSPAVGRMSSSVPRLAHVRVSDIPQAELTIEDARWVYTHEHGFGTWEEFTAFVGHVASGSQEEPFVEFIHAVEEGDTDVVERHLDRDPEIWFGKWARRTNRRCTALRTPSWRCCSYRGVRQSKWRSHCRGERL